LKFEIVNFKSFSSFAFSPQCDFMPAAD
jgi:hypothetical protein